MLSWNDNCNVVKLEYNAICASCTGIVNDYSQLMKRNVSGPACEKRLCTLKRVNIALPTAVNDTW